MTALEIVGLTKSYGGSPAVLDLTMKIDEGEFVTLLGPSGCGKTTTLNLLAGFLKPDSGSISVNGRVVSSPQGVLPPEKREMGLVFQSYALWPHKSVFDNVAYGLRRRKVSRSAVKDRVERMLTLVGLGDLGRRSPGELSGGQQQRVALARALVVEPTILLLDEPLSNLDAKLRESMRDELVKIQKRLGITFVYVTHDQAEAMSMSDRIAVLNKGSLVQYAAPREVYLDPASPFVADFMGLINFVDGTIVSLAATGEEATVRLALQDAPVLTARRAGARGRMQEGDSVKVAIRPESLLVEAVNPPEEALPLGAFSGIVRQVSLLGNIMHLFVDCGGGGPLRLQTAPSLVAEVGDRVSLRTTPDSALLFAASQHGDEPPARLDPDGERVAEAALP